MRQSISGRARLVSALLAIAWMALIFFLSSLPTVDMNLGFSGQDKLAHALAYGLLGSLLLIAQAPNSAGYGWRQIALATLLATLYGISDEWHQSFVPGRSPDGFDVLANGIGALLATTAVSTLVRWRLQRN